MGKTEVEKQTGMSARDMTDGMAKIKTASGSPAELKNEWLRCQIGKLQSPGHPSETFELIAYGKDWSSALAMFNDRMARRKLVIL